MQGLQVVDQNDMMNGVFPSTRVEVFTALPSWFSTFTFGKFCPKAAVAVAAMTMSERINFFIMRCVLYCCFSTNVPFRLFEGIAFILMSNPPSARLLLAGAELMSGQAPLRML